MARRVLDGIAEARAQQDNEAWHLLIMENLLAAEDFKQDVIRYRLNASFEDHAEHEYMSFVAGHLELDSRDYDREAVAGYGQYRSVADLLRHGRP